MIRSFLTGCLIFIITVTIFSSCSSEHKDPSNSRDITPLTIDQEQILEPRLVLGIQSCPTASISGFALDLFNAINNARVGERLPALAAHGCVVYVAQLRSNDMASRNYFSHSSPEGDTAFSLMDSYGVPYGWAGENLARNNYPNDETVHVAIDALMASEGHRANILSEHYTQAGVSVATDTTGIKYYTMIFIGPP